MKNIISLQKLLNIINKRKWYLMWTFIILPINSQYFIKLSPKQLKTFSAGSFPTSIFSVRTSKIHISDLNKSLNVLKDIYSWVSWKGSHIKSQMHICKRFIPSESTDILNIPKIKTWHLYSTFFHCATKLLLVCV